MVKRVGLVVFVCLTALLISSCSDSGTESGVHEQAALTSTECTGEDRGPCASTSSTSSNTSTSSSTESVGEDRGSSSTSSGRLVPSVHNQSGAVAVSMTCRGSLSPSKTPKTRCTFYLSRTFTKDVTVKVKYSGSARSNEYSFSFPDGYGAGSSSTHIIKAGDRFVSWFIHGKQTADRNETIVLDIISVTNAIELGTQRISLTLTEVNITNTTTTTSTDTTTTSTDTTTTSTDTTTTSTDTTTTTSTSITTFTAYVQNNPDLLAAYNQGSGQSIEEWGKWHYCNHGRNEGRVYTGTVNCSSTSTTTTTTSSDETGSGFEGYVNKYGDLLAAYNARGGGQTKSAWGKNHYCNYGRNEGRTYSGLSAASCSSTATTTTTSSTESCYGDYVRKYSDLLAAYNASGRGQSIETWGKSHYINVGQSEGRTACNASSDTTTTTTADTTSDNSSSSSSSSDDSSTADTTTTAPTDNLPAGDYQYLCKHNECSNLSGHTWRWPSNTINVYSGYPSFFPPEITSRGIKGSWPVNFRYGAVGGITLEPARMNVCGSALPERYMDGTIRGCRIKINFWVREIACGTVLSTVIHEIGHCIGFLGHTADGGLMDKAATGSTWPNATTQNMISLLYSLPPGTDISSRLRSYSRKGGYKYSRNNPQKLPPKVYYKPIRD